MDKFQRKKQQVIQFNYVNYNIKNPPNDKYMLALDTNTKELFIYNRGNAISITNVINKSLLNSNGKLKLQVIPKQLSDKVWTINEIQKHVSSVFRLKGVKKLYTDIYTTPNPQVGDVWICQVNGSEYVYVGKGKWEEFGPVKCVDTELLERIVDKLNTLQERLQQEINRAKAAEQELKQQIIATNVSVNNNTILINNLSTSVSNNLYQINTNISELSTAIQENTQMLSTAIDIRTEMLSTSISACTSSYNDENYEYLANKAQQIYNTIIG